MLGGAIGIALGDIIFTTELGKRLPRIPGADTIQTSGIDSFTRISQIMPPSLREQVQHAYTRSLSTLWIVSCALAFVGLLCSKLIPRLHS